MRLLLLLAGCWLLLLSIGLVAARLAADTAGIAAARDAHRARCAAIPMAGFTRDRANVFSGAVVDFQGTAVARAEIRVFDTATLLADAIATPPGAWPAPAPERSASSGPDGRYELRDLTYGSKLAVVGKPGHVARHVPEISFADGYGARDVDAALEPAADWMLTLREPDGRPAAGEPLRFLPRGLGLPAVAARADESGRVAVPHEVRCAAGSLDRIRAAGNRKPAPGPDILAV